MKRFLLLAVIMTVLFMAGCGENKNPNALPDNGAGAMMPDTETETTPDNSGIIGNAN